MHEKLNGEVTIPVDTPERSVVACSADNTLRAWMELHREHTDVVASARRRLVQYLLTEGFERCYEERRHYADPARHSEPGDDDESDGELVAGGSGSRRGLS